MKIKKVLSCALMCVLSLGVLAGCGQNKQAEPVATPVAEVIENVTSEPSVEPSAEAEIKVSGTVKVGALKGPTSLGLLDLNKGIEGSSEVNYEITMCTAADELLPQIIKGDLDIALVPANVAAILYNKTEGKVSAIDINTLGVLYFVSGSEEYSSVESLRGKTVYLTGKGTTPDFALQYVLKENGIDLKEVTLEYKSEATEVAAVLADNAEAVGLLPQPFVTSALMQNDKLKVVMDLDELFGEINGRHITTGVTVVRNDFLSENVELVNAFLKDHSISVNAVNADPAAAGQLAEEAGIIPKAPIATKAIPDCSISCITGNEMKDMVSSYLDILYGFEPSTVGGSLPGEDFYFVQ